MLGFSILRIIIDTYRLWGFAAEAMPGAERNPAVVRLRSWAEGMREAETDRALRQLPGLTPQGRAEVEALGKGLIARLLEPTDDFASGEGDGLPRSRRASIICAMFERQGAGCDLSHCPASAGTEGWDCDRFASLAEVAGRKEP